MNVSVEMSRAETYSWLGSDRFRTGIRECLQRACRARRMRFNEEIVTHLFELALLFRHESVTSEMAKPPAERKTFTDAMASVDRYLNEAFIEADRDCSLTVTIAHMVGSYQRLRGSIFPFSHIPGTDPRSTRNSFGTEFRHLFIRAQVLPEESSCPPTPLPMWVDRSSQPPAGSRPGGL